MEEQMNWLTAFCALRGGGSWAIAGLASCRTRQSASSSTV